VQSEEEIINDMLKCMLSKLLTRKENKIQLEVLTAVTMKIAVFWVAVPCTLVHVYHIPVYMALQPRRQPSSKKTRLM
jgi:hypothetical protein